MRRSLVRLRPRTDTLYTSRGFLSLATDRDGFIDDGSEHGFFAHETRMLSRYRYRVDGEALTPVALSNVDQHTWLGHYIREAPGNERGGGDHGSGMMDPESEYTLELQLHRRLGASVVERATITNYTQQPTAFRLTVEVDADFADLQETSGERKQEGTCERTWDAAARALTFDYRAEHAYDHQGVAGTASIHRRFVVRVSEADTPPVFADGCLTFDVTLAPGAAWHARLDWLPYVEAMPEWDLAADDLTDPDAALAERDRRDGLFFAEATTFETAESATLAPVVTAALDRARSDLAALRLYDLDRGERAWTLAAGLPIYLALFGRDALTAAWQGGLLGPEMLTGTLPALAHFQGTEDVPWRDERPGRMPHEAHTGPLARLRFNPFGRYYGSMTTSAFYPVAAAELWHWTGDRDLAFRDLGPTLDAFAWLDAHGDRDGDGFYEYLTRSEQGTKHQGWKDSPDAIVGADGRLIEPPIATCEEQAFVYQAKFAYAETLWQLGKRDDAERLFGEARDLKERFNDAFWLEDEGTYAIGLDADKRPIRAITSNPGHCLATGIVPAERAERVAERLFQPDLWSGWGIRTLSTENPAYNPYSYHRGSVWPVEHGTFALALMRYGLWDRLHQLCRAQFEAAALFDHVRLPEVFSGHARTDAQPFPAFYPQANSPQAWSASAVFTFVQALLGIYPYAPLHLLVVDPHLPEWLPELTVRGLRVGPATATIRFFRKDDGSSSYHVEHVEGPLHVVRQPSPWSLTATTGERIADALASLLPGK
ncbi:MAG: glycogen debranching N-terminal domain-containing protein [Rhodothermales bacterium]